MKALTVRQPWASLIAAGVKTIETRSWSTKYRGPLAIHAGAHRPTEGEELCGDSGWYWEWDVDHGIVIIGREPWNEHPAPLGAVVATCTLTDVLPITTYADIGDPECIVNHCDGTIDHAIPSDDDQSITVDPPGVTVVHLDALEIPDGVHLIREVNDQLPFGDFTPGRYAWLLTDITPTTVRCPICHDNPTGRERAWHQSHSGGICDAAHGSCFTPWCRCRCHVEARCPVCRGAGRCDPIPAKGRQGLWNWEADR